MQIFSDFMHWKAEAVEAESTCCKRSALMSTGSGKVEEPRSNPVFQYRNNSLCHANVLVKNKQTSNSCTAAFSLQHNSNSSEHRGGRDPPVRAGDHGHRADFCGAADRRYHPDHRRGLGSVSTAQMQHRGWVPGASPWWCI